MSPHGPRLILIFVDHEEAFDCRKLALTKLMTRKCRSLSVEYIDLAPSWQVRIFPLGRSNIPGEVGSRWSLRATPDGLGL